MKRFLIGTGAKISRFFWSWKFLKFALWTATLIVFFYVEEDWRGARAWAATKAEWEARGESFDFNKFIPPPVPDDQNLAAIPLFRLEPFSKTNTPPFSPYPLALKKALREELPGNNLPKQDHWQRGELFNREQFHQIISADYAETFKGANPPNDALAQFEALYPFLADLRAAAETRPLCRFNPDYAVSPPVFLSFGPLIYQFKLSTILTLHAILAMDQHQSDLALRDIKINVRLLFGAKRCPTLIGDLIGLAMMANGDSVIWNGLALHAWNDAQLAEIEQTLEPINFLADYQFSLRTDAAESITDIDYFKIKNDHITPFFAAVPEQPASPLLRAFRMISRLFVWPGGWWDHNKSRMASFLMCRLTTVDPQSLRVFPKIELNLDHQVEVAHAQWRALAPWNIWWTVVSSSFAMTSTTQKYAVAQTRVDEARIACALERYRLAHGLYPDSLDALAPACINEVPHDIMNGQPYHYRLQPDGTFLLYSVGWNQTDEGGKMAYHEEVIPYVVNYDEGDWTWPVPQAVPEK